MAAVADTLLRNATLGTAAADILLSAGTVARIAPTGTIAPTDGCTTIDCTGLHAFAGLRNMHSHAPMTLLRGLGDDQPLDRWLTDYVWPAEQRLTDQLVYQGTLHACHEMLASGTTFFNDMYFRLPAMAQAVEESGIRARLGLNVFGNADELLPYEQGLLGLQPTANVQYSIAPHSVYTVSEQGLQRAARLCLRLGLPMHIHMSETEKEVADCLRQYGCRPWQLLHRLGVLDMLGHNLIAAHCLHLSDEEIALMGRYHVTAVHCPNSNLKLGSGYRFLLDEMLAQGVNIALGTDGSASSNNLDMVEVMKTAALLQKGWRNQPTAAPASQIYSIATQGATLAVGQVADLFLARLNSAPASPLAPQTSGLSTLVYATHGDATMLTIVGGRIVYMHPSAPSPTPQKQGMH